MKGAPDKNCGSAALQRGKALSFRALLPLSLVARLSLATRRRSLQDFHKRRTVRQSLTAREGGKAATALTLFIISLIVVFTNG